MIFVGVVMCLGSLLCSWYVGSIRVVARDARARSSLWWNRGLSPMCSLSCTVFTLSIWSCVCPDGVVRGYSILVLSLTFSSHRGARCFKSVSVYLRVWHRFLSYLA